MDLKDRTTVGETIGEHLQHSTTRRTVVKTGAKLAYAAPIVAASFSLASQRAAAAVSGANPNPECAAATCTTFVECSSTNADCVCTSTSSGGGFCVPGSTSCTVTGDCGAGFSCPADNVCVVDTCCGRPVCVPIALNDQCPAGDGAGAAGVRQSSGPGTIGG